MNSEERIAVASRSFSVQPVLREELLSRYANVTFNDVGRKLAGEELVRFLEGHTKAILALEKLTRNVIVQLPQLRVIGKYGVGIDNLDLRAMAEHRIALGWTPGVNRRSVAELAIAYCILSLRRGPELMAEVRAGTWRQLPGRELRSATVGIIGCGHVGKEVVCLLRPFGCRILVHDIRPPTDFYREHGIQAASLDHLLAESDVVSIHVSLNPTSRGLLSRERLAQMKPGACLVNLARGGIVDERALKEALNAGTISSAAFDVFAVEPPDDPELVNHPRFLASPHIGGSSHDAILEMGRAAISGLDQNVDPHEYLRRGYLEFSDLQSPKDLT